MEELYEAWEFQQKYGARAARSADAAAADEQPPPFQTFIPGKTCVPRRPTTAAAAGDAAADTPSAHASHASAAAQRAVRPAATHPLGIAPPPGFDPLPASAHNGLPPAAAAAVAGSGLASQPPAVGRGSAKSGAAAPDILGTAPMPSRASAPAAARAKLQERLAASEAVRDGPCACVKTSRDCV